MVAVAGSQIVKVDVEHGLVFGFGIVCLKNGKPYYDLNVDPDGERVPEHIPEDSMLDAVTEFMQGERIHKEMHAGETKGTVVHSFPLTSDIAKALDIETKTTGWLVAVKPDDPAVLAKFRDGTYKGFSIGGNRVTFEEHDDYEPEAA